jgi:hypothetical protein
MDVDDWYEDGDGNIQYDASIKSQGDLDAAGISGTYLGEQGMGIDPNFGMAMNYNSNGSISFSENQLSEVSITASRPSIVELPSSEVASLSSFGGAAATAYSDFNVSGGKFRGASGNYYSYAGRQGWNQYTGTKARMNSVLNKAKLTTNLNYGFGALSAAGNVYNYGSGNINEVQFGIEMGSTAIGTFAPPIVSIPWTIGYEGLGRNGVARILEYPQ